VAFLVVLATRRTAEQAEADSPLLGKPAPEVTGTGIDGSTIRLSQLRGRYVLVNFFASWCIPCLREHDDLNRFQEAHRAAGDATVLAVTFNDSVENAREFFEQRGGEWPVLADDRGKVALDFGVRGPPESFLIDPNGVVLTKIIGEVDFDGLESLLRRAKASGR
jgi:cytochrome c biogenesis protein CcmG/thiol:disulfide interchange protein DsbE